MAKVVEELILPKYVLLLHGPKFLTGPTYTVLTFATLDEFKAYADAEDLTDDKIIGLYPLGEPVAIQPEEVVVEVTKRAWNIPT